MKKRFFLTFALVTMLSSAFAATINYAYPLVSGQEGPGTIYYKLNTATHEATVVSGTWEYTGVINIPDELEYNGATYLVTTIDKNAFYYCYDLDEVHFGANVSTIKKSAFYRCGSESRPIRLNLDSDGLTTIEEEAFKEVAIRPNAPDSISILLGKNITQLGPTSATSMNNWYTWGSRYNVQRFAVAEGNTILSTDANGVLYNKDKTTLIAVPTYYQPTAYEIPSSVTTVRSFALHSMKYLRTVTGGNNVVRIGSVVSGITSIHLGPNVSEMPTTYIFMYSSLVPDIDENNTTFKLIDNVLFKCSAPDTILCWFLRTNRTANYVLPSFVTEIGKYAFYSNQYIKTIDFANNTKVTSKKIGDEAFLGTKYSVEFLNAANVYANVDGVWYTSGATDSMQRMVMYGSGVEIENYVMPAQTKTIPRDAIKANTNVKTFAINNVLDKFDTQNNYLFSNLEAYSVDANNATFSADEDGVLYNKAKTKLISYPRGNKRVYYKVADGTQQIGTYAFYSNTYLKVLDLGSSITSVVEGNNNSMGKMAELKAIRVSTMVPPTVTTSSFSDDMIRNGTIKLYVPLEDGAADIYANASVWNRFYIIRDTSRFDSDIQDIDVNYVVKHYQQNLNDDEYTLSDMNNRTGKLLGTTDAAPRTDGEYAGFVALTYSQITLNRSGMSVDIHYDRRLYTVSWVSGGEEIFSDSYRYGAEYLSDKPDDQEAPAGKHFLGWNTDADATVALSFNGNETVSANTTYYAIFADNAQKPYVVKHYKQNIEDDNYPATPAAVDNLEASFGLQTSAVAKTYEGFTAQEFAQQTIAEDGSTVVSIYYERNRYTVTWMNGTSEVLTGSYKFDSTLVVPNTPQAVAGKHFVGWNTDPAAETGLNLEGQSVPAGNVVYFAIFASNESKIYTIKHYQQSLDCENYALFETEAAVGIEGTYTNAAAKSYAGFTAQDFEQNTITDTGAVIQIYYNRNRYDVIWKNGVVELSRTTDCLFGSAVEAPANPSAEAGEHFIGWNTDASAASALSLDGATVPVDGVTYYAIFATNATVHYTVKHYQENLDGTYPTEPTNTDEGTGVFGLQTLAQTRTYVGFTAKQFNQATIAEDGSTVVSIQYERNVHSLAWNGNNGNLSGGTSGSAIKYGTPITAPTASRTGHTFFGWGTSANAGETVSAPLTMPDENLSFFALWTVNTYHAAWYLNNGTDTEFTGFNFNFGDSITPPAGNPQTSDYEHHDFLGWSSSSDGNVITDGNYGVMTTAGASFYAIWQVHANTLTWNVNGGGTLHGNYTSGLVDYGTHIIKPGNPNRVGYTFRGWATTANGSPVTVQQNMPDENLTYYAVWEINQHSISWNANGGNALEGDFTSGNVNYGAAITKPTDPTRTGYDFVGWGTEANATETVTPATTMPDNDLHYFAVWQVHTHNLTWDANGGQFVNGNPSDSVAYGDTIVIPQVSRSLWKCAGWATSANATPDDAITPAATMPDNDLTYYAIWIPKTHYVTWKRNYDADDDYNFSATSVNEGSTISAPANNPEQEHHHFLGWAASRNGEVLTDFGTLGSENLTFFAQWELNRHQLTWNANGGQITTTGTHGTVEYGATIIASTASRTGYSFAGWGLTVNATEAAGITTMPDEDVEFFAIWTPNQYDVTWMKNDGTSEVFDVTEVVFGTPVTAPLEPAREHYQFVGWAATPEGEIIANFGELATEGATYYAKWQLRTYNLAWNANGGELSGDYTQGVVAYGTQIVSPEATLENYIHAGWGTSLNPDSVVNITTMPDSNVVYVAIWTPNTYVVEWRKNDGTDANFAATNVDFNSQIVAPDDEPQRGHYQFLGWAASANGAVITDFGTMNSTHKTFFAKWQINSNTLAWNANGGELSGSYTSGTVDYGTEIVCPIVTRTGYTFAGWNTYPEATDSITVGTMPDANIVYYAVWKINTYDVEWKFNNGTTENFTTTHVAFDSDIQAPEMNPARAHYQFLGWSESANGAIVTNFGTMSNYNRTFYAQWSINKHNLAWHANGGEITTTGTNGLVEYGATITPSTVSRTGYSFEGWGLTANAIATEAVEVTTMPDADADYYAIWQPEVYTVAWRFNNGTTVNFTTTQVAFNSQIQAPAMNPARAHYQFLGWAASADGDTITNFGTLTTEGATFYAQWNINKHNLTWHANGGEITTTGTNGLVEYGAAITPSTAVRTGYSFVGWGLTDNATEAVEVTTMPDADADYYAIWQPEVYTVAWRFNNGTTENFTTTQVAFDSQIQAPAMNPARAHYQFLGWAASADGETITNFGTLTTKGATFFAKWNINKHNLTWHANGGEITTTGTNGLVEYGATITPSTASRTGYSFVGWGLTDNATEAVEVTTMPDADADYYAIWQPEVYTVAWRFNNGTAENFTTTQVAFDSQIQAPAMNPARAHYQFLGWAASADGETITNFGTLTTEGATFYAKWNINRHTLTWNANGGELSGDYTQGSVEFGAQIAAPTASRDNYIHAGWGTTAKPDSAVSITTMPDNDVEYVAIWTPNSYVAEWRMNDETEANFTAFNVDFGSPIAAPVVNPERAHYQFLGWAATADGEVVTDFGTMDSDHKIFYAQWQINSHTLAWNANGGELSGDYTQGLVEFDSVLARPEASRTGYTFNGWNTYADATDSISITTMPDNDVEYFALWSINSYAATWYFTADSVFSVSNLNYADSIDVPAENPEREGFTFQGWSADTLGVVIDTFGIITADTAFFAVWQEVEPDTVWVAAAWQMNDGTDSTFMTQQYVQGDTIAAPAINPQREGYTFQGWSADTLGVVIDSFGIITADTAFYAVWQEVEPDTVWVAAAWQMNDGTDSTFMTQQYVQGDTIAAPAINPEREGFTFQGWSADTLGVVIDSFGIITTDTAFFAVWEEVEPDTVWVAAAWQMNDGTGSTFMTQQYVQGDTIAAPAENPEREGFTFQGWSADTLGVVIDSFGIITADTAFFAVWQEVEPDTVWVAAAWQMNDGTDSIFMTQQYVQGDTIAAPAINPEREGFTFQGWSADSLGVVIDSFGIITADTAFYAVWEVVEPDTVWFAAAWQMNDGTDSTFMTQQYVQGDTIAAPVNNPEREGFTFQGWSADTLGVVIDSFGIINADTAFFAVWEKNPPMQYAAVWYLNDGTNSVFRTIKVNDGDVISAPLIKPTRDLYEFLGWSATATGVVTTNFGTMTEAGAAFYAVWAPIVYFEAPENFNSCESGNDFIQLTAISHSSIVFEWNVNGDVDSIQTDGYFEFTDEMALSGTIEVTGVLGNNRLTRTIKYQRNKDMLRTMWDDVITVVNGEGHFKSYKWYQNGVLVDTAELHYEAGGLTGTYQLIAITVDDEEITSCEVTFSEPTVTAITVYPNPAVSTIQVESTDLVPGVRISILDGDGKVRMSQEATGDGREQLNVSGLPQGIYIVKIGSQSASIIKL